MLRPSSCCAARTWDTCTLFLRRFVADWWFDEALLLHFVAPAIASHRVIVWTYSLVARLEPMAVIPSLSAQPAPFGRSAPTCRRGFACPYPRRRCCFFGHSLEEVAAESEAISCRAATMPLLLVWVKSSSRSWVRQCRRLSGTVCSMCRRSACRIVMGS